MSNRHDHLKVSLDQEHGDQRLKVEDSTTSLNNMLYQLPLWSDSLGGGGAIAITPPQPERRTVFFDLDNTLYSKSLGIHNQMADRIQLFMNEVLLLPKEESRRLSARYYLDYGLSVRGILNDFQIETSEYDRFVDGGIEMDHLLRPCEGLTSWIQSIQASKWIFTNAGLKHAERVLKLLEIRHLFDGIIYCDYGERSFPAKPERLAYERAMKWAGVKDPGQCYFIDDSANNVRVAMELGWRAAHYDEDGEVFMSLEGQSQQFPRIRTLEELTNVFPELQQPEELSSKKKVIHSNLIDSTTAISSHSI